MPLLPTSFKLDRAKAVRNYMHNLLTQPDTSRGWFLANQRCKDCHVVAVDQPTVWIIRPFPGPSFKSISQSLTADSIKRFLKNDHQPNVKLNNLSEKDREDLAAYILSLSSDW